MKLQHLSIIAGCLTLLAGCVDENLSKPEPVVPGSEVSFTLGLDKTTRTIYSPEENEQGAWPIYWVDGDRVNIVSPDLDSPASPYRISVDGNEQNYANGITTINANGIQWGDKQPTADKPIKFYSVYPQKYNLSFGDQAQVKENTLVKGEATSNTPVTANLSIRRDQINMFRKVELLDATDPWVGQPIDRASNEDLSLCQQNPDAIMYAQKKQETGGDVLLQYKPLSTALHIKIEDINGFDNVEQDSITIFSFKLTAPETTKLTGDFTAIFNADCESKPEITYNPSTSDNVITVSTITNVAGRYLRVSKSTHRSLEFNIFVVPQTTETIDVNGWKLELRTDHGDFETGLVISDDGNGVLQPGMMHKLNLTAVTGPSNYELTPESWMEDIPDNVYATELTLPGAWYATDSEYQGSGVTIASLYQKGVRSFAVETKSWCATNSSTPTGVCLSGTGTGTSGNHNGGYGNSVGTTATRLSSTIQSLLEQVAKTPNEFSVLVLSYASEGDGGKRDVDHNYWLEGVQLELNNAITAAKNSGVTNVENIIFGYNGDELTPNTVVGDVRGKLLIKLNMDERFQNATRPTGNFPVAAAYASYTWDSTLTPDQINKPLMSHGFWGLNNWFGSIDWTLPTDQREYNIPFDWTSDTALEDKLKQDPEALHFAYSNANRTYHLDQGVTTPPEGYDKTIPTSYNRQSAITALVDASYNIYNLGGHNIWFQMGAGGIRADSGTGSSTENGAAHFAVHFNQFFYKLIESKMNSDRPSPLGLVLCNYITQTATTSDDGRWGWTGNGFDTIVTGGGTVGGDYTNSFDGNTLVNIILQFNNLFYLQRDPNWTPDKNVQSAAANYSSGMKVAPASAGGWVAF